MLFACLSFGFVRFRRLSQASRQNSEFRDGQRVRIWGDTMIAKKSYAAPQLLKQRPVAFDDPQKEASPEDLTATERLRPLYLLNRRTDLKPIATRFAIHGDRRRGNWQKVLLDPGTVQESEWPGAEGEWYFLCYVPHSSHLTIELQTLGPDAKTRIAIANEVSIPAERKLGLVVLSKKSGVVPFAAQPN
jgi:hypothetical protein